MDIHDLLTSPSPTPEIEADAPVLGKYAHLARARDRFEAVSEPLCEF